MRVFLGRRKPVVLVWLLPYLLFSLAGGGLHSHLTSPSAGRAIIAAALAHAEPDAVSPAQRTSCAACYWLLHAGACHTLHAHHTGQPYSASLARPIEGAGRAALLCPHLSRAPPIS